MTSGENVQISLPSYESILTEAITTLAVDAGVVSSPTAAGGNALQDSLKRWATGMHVNRVVKVISGAGKGQQAIIQGNSLNVLVTRGAWTLAIEAGSRYVILDADYAQVLRDVLGGGVNISAANPLPVDFTPGQKTAQTILTLANLAAGATSAIGACASVDLRQGPATLALTVVATYNAAATQGLRFHVRTSPDNVNWDTEDWDAWNAGFTAGATIRETATYETNPMFVRVLIENLDAAQAITGILVVASVGV